MFDKVVVGVRDAAQALDEIALARVLAPQAELHLVHAYPMDPTAWPGPEPWRVGLRSEAEKVLSEVAREASIDTPTRVLPDLSPARALHMVAEEIRAGLIVVGSAHHGPVGRLLAGSVGRSVLTGSPCPVAVAPKGYENRRPATVGVAFDGSRESYAALRQAAAIARNAGARLRVLRIVALPHEVVAPMYPLSYAKYDWEQEGEQQTSHARSEVERAVAEVRREPGVDAEGEVLFGHARRELTAMTEHLDLLATGSRAWGPARRVLLGGTSSHLVHHAACPVLVVPRGAGDEQAPQERATQVASA
jgi:nucleotide-binding universal stress UspA family protein